MQRNDLATTHRGIARRADQLDQLCGLPRTCWNERGRDQCRGQPEQHEYDEHFDERETTSHMDILKDALACDITGRQEIAGPC